MVVERYQNDNSILFFEEDVKEITNWVRDNKQLGLIAGYLGIPVSISLLFSPVTVPSWRPIYMLAILWFMSLGGVCYFSLHFWIGLRIALPVLYDKGMILPFRECIGKVGYKPENRQHYFIPYTSIIDVMHFKIDTNKGTTEWIWIKFRFNNKIREVTMYKGKLLHNVDKFVEILRSKGIEFRTTHFNHT